MQEVRPYVVEARKLTDTQQALRTSQAEAEHANQAKSLFLANVSHELRTPLASLIGTNELLQDTELNPEQGRFVRIMDRCCEDRCCAASTTMASPSASARASANRLHRADARIRRM